METHTSRFYFFYNPVYFRSGSVDACGSDGLKMNNQASGERWLILKMTFLKLTSTSGRGWETIST